MLKTKNKDSNYLAKVVALEGLRKHSNADRLQCVNVGFNNVITGLDAKEGDIYVFFPIESKINKDFLHFINGFRDSKLNLNPSVSGFFEVNCRVKAVRLRGERSMGFLVPSFQVAAWAGFDIFSTDVGTKFDTIAGKLLCEKYEVPVKESRLKGKGKEPKLDRLVEGQVRLHVNTTNFRHEPEAIKPDDLISITYKTHGTSWWAGNLLVKRKLSRFERVLKFLGVSVPETEYDIVYGSRRVVKNRHFEDPKAQDHFFGYDLWHDVKEEVKNKIPKGITLYGELLGFTRDGAYIQEHYDYGCSMEKGAVRQRKEIYRITHTDEDGHVTEYSYPQIIDFCKLFGLVPSHLMFYGTARDWVTQNRMGKADESFGVKFVKALQAKYNDKDCFMCKNPVPEEGIVVRKENLYNCESYKLKSFQFLEFESSQLDQGVSDGE